MVAYRECGGKSLESTGGRGVEAGADVGGAGTGEMAGCAEGGCASTSDKGKGPVGHEGLKKESFNDFFVVGTGANSMRGVTSVSEAELEDDDAGADEGADGSRWGDEKGEAKKAWVFLPLEKDCSSMADERG